MVVPPTPIPPGCPWHDLSQYGLPNVNWCEAPLCSYIGEPANTWSNLAYVLVGLFVLLWGGEPARLRRSFAPVMALVGICSGIYHASNVYVTQQLDFLGMYLFCYLLLGLNLNRLGMALGLRHYLVAVLGTTAFTAVVFRYGFPIQAIIGVLTLGIIVTEGLARRRHPAQRVPLSAFLASLGLLTAGAISSALDVTRTLCDPENHFLQGHAVWHVLTALSLLASFFHYRRLAHQAG